MKNLKRIYKYTLSAPKTVAELAEYNSARIGVLIVVIMITIVALAFTSLLPTWSFIK